MDMLILQLAVRGVGAAFLLMFCGVGWGPSENTKQEKYKREDGPLHCRKLLTGTF